ncbi:MAG: Chromosome partitioning protein ParA [Firmicutes bacterium ADurb.Bin456]|nr:MAG: Chromosome partitioning protein ParA [Firmicutes bacterium ADurb.Bin456]
MGTRIIALVNQKGGTGKTTSAIGIGAGLARKRRKVLLIDMDPQANLTYSLGLEVTDTRATIYEVIKGKATADQAIIKREGKDGGPAYDVIPATIDLEGAELEIAPEPGRELFLKEALEPIAARYDYILIDAPPRLTVLTLNALTAAKELFIPLQAEVLPLRGLRKLETTAALVKKRLNPKLLITGIIITRFSGRKSLSREILEVLKEPYGDVVFKTCIRENVSIAEAPSWGRDIFEYKANSNGALDYGALCEEIITQEGGQQ